MVLENIVIILHQLKGEENLGAVARAMANTGLRELRLSAPRCRIGYSAFRISALPQAHRILKQVKVYEDLVTAVQDLQFSVGTTARQRHNIRQLLTPDEVASRALTLMTHSKIGILFGPEERGLSNEELLCCDVIATIPVNEECPSYNVAHAVLLMCYTLMLKSKNYRELKTCPVKQASQNQINSLLSEARDLLLQVGFLNPQSPSGILLELRQLAGRAQLSEREVTILRGICRRIRNQLKLSAEK
ncbi:MAG: RNA methyltransferase [Candidatus Sumerlaeia bacterium]|nr:RNA methyltransferase [Candidatus Sumerlaeia bacterium]